MKKKRCKQDNLLAAQTKTWLKLAVLYLKLSGAVLILVLELDWNILGLQWQVVQNVLKGATTACINIPTVSEPQAAMQAVFWEPTVSEARWLSMPRVYLAKNTV